MTKTGLIPAALLFLLLTPGMSFSMISQYFDSDGNQLVSAPKTGHSKSVAARYSVPEGLDLIKDINYEYYLVFGKTFTEIVIASQENGPSNSAISMRLPSKIEWNIGWTYDFGYAYTVDDETRLVHIAVELYDINFHYDITITLPALLDDTVLTPVEKDLWKNYLLRILQHEHEHVKIIKDPEVRESLLKRFDDINYFIVDYRSDIDIEKLLESTVKNETLKAGRESIKKIKDRNDDYDRKTDYGRKIEMKESFIKTNPSD